MAAPKEQDLHALLDDALEGFDRGAAHRDAASQPPLPAGAAAAQEQPPAQPPVQQPGSGGRPRALAFDPLARRGALARRDAAAAGDATGGVVTGGGRPTQAAPAGDEADADELDVLSKGLSRLLAELATADEEGREAAIEAAEEAASAGASQQPPAGQQQREEQQQEQLQATLRALSEQAPSFASQGGSEDEMLRLLAEHLGALGDEGGSGNAADSRAGGGAGTAPGMASLVDTIMQQLLSKEVLYQPMKDIGGRYPEWLEANKDKLSPEDTERYQQQLVFIRRICELYETNPSDYAQLVDLLQQMQQCGQPPQEIVDELAPGMQFGPDGLPSFAGDEQVPAELRDCVIQ